MFNDSITIFLFCKHPIKYRNISITMDYIMLPNEVLRSTRYAK